LKELIFPVVALGLAAYLVSLPLHWIPGVALLLIAAALIPHGPKGTKQ
jgi:hypothetical protein